MKKIELKEVMDFGDIEGMSKGEYKERLLKTRIGQYFFRMAVLNSYKNHCCITGLSQTELLIASHIKPWADCDDKTERTNPQNGLCLNSLHDKAFDKGLITLKSDYTIVISSKLNQMEMDKNTRDWFWRYSGQKIIMPEKFFPGKEFIEYHNDVIFQG